MAAMLLLCIIAGLMFLLHKMMSAKRNYWKERGIPHVAPIPYIGNMLDNLLKKKSAAEVVRDIGVKFKDEPLVGFYQFTKPVLLVNCPEYAEIVLVKEFSSFMNRGEELKLEDRRPFDKHLFFITGSAWKGVRSKLTPVFTTAKLKEMMPEIEHIFDKTLKKITNTNESIEINDLVEKFIVRVRASCVFGIDLSKPDSGEDEFIRRVNSMSQLTLATFAETTIALFFPRIAKLLNLSFVGTDNEKYFVQVLLNSFKARSESNVGKQDFVQTMLELKNKGKVEVHNWTKEDDFLKTEDKNLTTETIVIDDDILISQSLMFLVAGLEPELGTLTMLLVELTQNPHVLEKLKQEIDSVVNKHKEFSYQALREMEYLEFCIQETLRIHTPAALSVRSSAKTYTFPNGTTVEKGVDIFIPTLKFHEDSSIYPDPFTFKPERFSEASLPPCAYLPFGSGPRICIGMRFAMMELKLFTAKLIYTHSISLDPKTELPVKTDKWYFLRKNSSPIYMKFSPRTH